MDVHVLEMLCKHWAGNEWGETPCPILIYALVYVGESLSL